MNGEEKKGREEREDKVRRGRGKLVEMNGNEGEEKKRKKAK